MHEKDCSPEVLEVQAASITDEEVREIFHGFLMQEFNKLKERFPSLSDFGIAIFARTRCFITRPHTDPAGLPIMADGKDIYELWSKVVEYALTQGLEASNFPTESTPYKFFFRKRYDNT